MTDYNFFFNSKVFSLQSVLFCYTRDSYSELEQTLTSCFRYRIMYMALENIALSVSEAEKQLTF